MQHQLSSRPPIQPLAHHQAGGLKQQNHQILKGFPQQNFGINSNIQQQHQKVSNLPHQVQNQQAKQIPNSQQMPLINQPHYNQQQNYLQKQGSQGLIQGGQLGQAYTPNNLIQNANNSGNIQYINNQYGQQHPGLQNQKTKLSNNNSIGDLYQMQQQQQQKQYHASQVGQMTKQQDKKTNFQYAAGQHPSIPNVNQQVLPITHQNPLAISQQQLLEQAKMQQNKMNNQFNTANSNSSLNAGSTLYTTGIQDQQNFQASLQNQYTGQQYIVKDPTEGQVIKSSSSLNSQQMIAYELLPTAVFPGTANKNQNQQIVNQISSGTLNDSVYSHNMQNSYTTFQDQKIKTNLQQAISNSNQDKERTAIVSNPQSMNVIDYQASSLSNIPPVNQASESLSEIQRVEELFNNQRQIINEIISNNQTGQNNQQKDTLFSFHDANNKEVKQSGPTDPLNFLSPAVKELMENMKQYNQQISQNPNLNLVQTQNENSQSQKTTEQNKRDSIYTPINLIYQNMNSFQVREEGNAVTDLKKEDQQENYQVQKIDEEKINLTSYTEYHQVANNNLDSNTYLDSMNQNQPNFIPSYQQMQENKNQGDTTQYVAELQQNNVQNSSQQISTSNINAESQGVKSNSYIPVDILKIIEQYKDQNKNLETISEETNTDIFQSQYSQNQFKSHFTQLSSEKPQQYLDIQNSLINQKDGIPPYILSTDVEKGSLNVMIQKYQNILDSKINEMSSQQNESKIIQKQQDEVANNEIISIANNQNNLLSEEQSPKFLQISDNQDNQMNDPTNNHQAIIQGKYENEKKETQQLNQNNQQQDNYKSNIQQLIYQKTDEIKNQIDSLQMNTINVFAQKEQNPQANAIQQENQDFKNKDFTSTNDYSIHQNAKFGRITNGKIQFEDGLAISTINPTESYINDTKYFNQNLTDAQEELLKTQQTQESNIQITDTYMITRTEDNESVKKSMKKVEQIASQIQNSNSTNGDNAAYNFQATQDNIKINDFNELVRRNESPTREKPEEKVLDRINQLLKQHKERSSSVASSVSSTPQQKVIEGVTLEDIENLIDKKMGQLVEKLRIKKLKRKTSDAIKKKEGDASIKNRKSIEEINQRKSSVSSTSKVKAEELEEFSNENFNEKYQKQIKKQAPRNINTSQEQLVITISAQQQQPSQQIRNKPISLSELEINKFGSNQDAHRLPTEEEELINLYSQKTVYTSQIDQQELKNSNNSDLYQNFDSNNINKINLNVAIDNNKEEEQEEVTVNDVSPTKTINSSPRNRSFSSSEQLTSQQDEFFITVETEENQDEIIKQNLLTNQEEDQKLKVQKVINNYIIEEKEEDETPQNSAKKDPKLNFNLKGSFNEAKSQSDSNKKQQQQQYEQLQANNQIQQEQELEQQQQENQQQQQQQQGTGEIKISKQIQKILKVEKQASPSKFQNMAFGEKAQKLIQRGLKSSSKVLTNNNSKSEKNLNIYTISQEELKTPKSSLAEKTNQTVRSQNSEGNYQEKQEKKVKIQELSSARSQDSQIPPRDKKVLKTSKTNNTLKPNIAGKIQVIQIQQQQQQQHQQKKLQQQQQQPNKLQKVSSTSSLNQKDQLQKILNQKKSQLQQQINEINNQIQNLQEEDESQQDNRRMQEVQLIQKVNVNKNPLLISPTQSQYKRYDSPQVQHKPLQRRSKSQEKLQLDIQQINKPKQIQKPIDIDLRNSKLSKSKTRGEYLYEIAILQNEKKKILQEMHKKSETQRQSSECTFSPKIKQTNNQFQQLSFTERQQVWQKKKLEKTKSLVSTFSGDDSKDCTFRPELMKRLDTNKEEYFIQEFQKQIQKLNAKKLVRQMNSSSPKSRISNKNLSASKISGSQMINTSSQSSTLFQPIINSKGSTQQKFHKNQQDSVLNSANQSGSKYYQQQTGYQLSNSYKRNQQSSQKKNQKANKTQETVVSNKTELELIQEYQRLVSILQSKAPVPIQLQKKDDIFTLDSFNQKNNQFTNSQDYFQDDEFQQFDYVDTEQIAKSNRTQQSFNKQLQNTQFN